MRAVKDDGLAVGLAAAIAALIIVPVLIWFVAAAFVADDGCAWIAGVGGCLPWATGPG